jgi:hypothetical protein
MNTTSTFLKTSLATLLLACCTSGIAQPEAGSQVLQQGTVDLQATAPAMPADRTATGQTVPATASTVNPMANSSPTENPGNQAAGTGDGTHEIATVAPDDPLPAGEAEAGAPEEAGLVEDPETLSAPGPVIDPVTLYGEWTVKEQHPDAGEVVTLFSINSDSSFAGTMTVAGNVVWRYSGNWYLDGNLITWFYTQSTPPLMLADETEVDEIIDVDSEKLIYRSGKRDVLETLYRAR